MKITESQLRNIIKEAINELDWKTYANAAKKAKEWREKNPNKYDRNRGMSFDRAAVNAFNKQHDIDNLPNFGGERGNINFSSDNGNVKLSGSRDHDFGYDKSGMLNHNVTHLSKQYGKDGKYGRTRMWDRAYETTPEEFYDDEEMGTKFRNAEKDVEDFNSGKYSYDNKKGWHLKESQLRNIIQESVKKVLKEIHSTDGMGWMGLNFDEEDWIPVNKQSDGDTCFKIKVWCGSGYSLDAFKAYAEHGDYEGALEALVAYLDKEGNDIYFTDKWTSDEIAELKEKGYSEEEINYEIEKWGDIYIDATHLGASKPHWLRGENLAIQEFPN